MKTENVAESHQTDIPYTFPAGHETRGRWRYTGGGGGGGRTRSRALSFSMT